MDYVNEYRLRCAANMLASSTENMTEIAAACGFSSPSHFSKLFREKYHVTSSEGLLFLQQNEQ